MPRIEYIPADYDPSSGDGSPTFDCCTSCASDFEEGDSMPEYTQAGIGEGVVGVTDVDHPPYEECDYACEVCGASLDKEDN